MMRAASLIPRAGLGRRLAAILCLAVLLAAGCERLLLEPARASASLSLSVTPDPAIAADVFSDAFDQVDRVFFRIQRSNHPPVEGIREVTPAGEVKVSVTIEMELDEEPAVVIFELRRGTIALFRAEQSVLLKAGTSPAIELPLSIVSPTPAVSSLTPSGVVAGSGAFTLTVAGTNFTPVSRVLWNGTERATQFVSATELRTNIAAADVQSAGAATVAVLNPPPGGASNSLSFQVVPPPGIELSAGTVGITGVQGGGNPPTQTVNITNGGGGTLSGLAASISYPTGQPGGWLAAQLSSTTAPATLTLQATTGNLPPGGYGATVSIAAPGAVNSPRTVSVSFTVGAAGSYTLTVLPGNGNGSITSTPTGINCTLTAGTPGGSCQAGFEAGSQVVLTPTAGADFRFGGWSGDCAGTAPCTLTMSAARSVAPSFVPLVAPTISNPVPESELNSPLCTVPGISTRTAVVFDYFDPDGDVGNPVLIDVTATFQPSGTSESFTLSRVPDGSGTSGTLRAGSCTVFGANTQITFSFSIKDLTGRQSNTLIGSVPRPPGAP